MPQEQNHALGGRIDKHVVIAVGRFDGTFEMTVTDDAVNTQNASEPLDSDTNTSLRHERMHLTILRSVVHFWGYFKSSPNNKSLTPIWLMGKIPFANKGLIHPIS